MVSKIIDEENSGEFVFTRPNVVYTNNCKKYLIRERTFDRQYASLYICRLKACLTNLHECAKKKWGK